MINSPNNRLDEFVKQSLENYQVPFNEAHWKEFESKLGSQPRVNPFTQWKFSLNTIIGGVVILSAAALIYAVSSTNYSSPVTNTSVTSNKNTPVPSDKKVTVPVVSTNTTTANNNEPVT